MHNRQEQTVNNSIGTCVVFNCINFIKDGKKDEDNKREGSEHDGKKIKNTFLNFKFDVVTILDPTKEDIEGEIERIEKMQNPIYENLLKKEFFICFILSHGTDSCCITTSDHNSIDLKNGVIDRLHGVSTLKEKNKIIIQQTCRGNLEDEGEIQGNQMALKNMLPEYEPVTPITSHPNFFIVFASTPGYKSYRGEDGTTFIHMFCDMLEEHRSKLSLSELVQRLIFTISCIPVYIKVENKYQSVFQIPNVFSTLQSPLLLHHGKKNENQDERPKDYKLKDELVHKEINNIISSLHKRSSTFSSVPGYPSGKKSGYLLLAKKTPGSYDMPSKDVINYYLVIDIHKDQCTYEKVESVVKTIQNKMHKLDFTGKIVSSKDIKDPNTNKINVKDCIPKGQEICCFLCFIQLDKEQNTETNEDIKEIMSQLKGQNSLLDKPKVFILQPHLPDNISVTDGQIKNKRKNIQTPPEVVKISKESDLLIMYTTPANARCKTMTEMFCETIIESNMSIIDLIESDLPKRWKDQWTNVKPSISSTMRKHLLIRQEPENENMVERKETDKQHLNELKIFKKEIQSNKNNKNVLDTDVWQYGVRKPDHTAPLKRTNMVCGCIMVAVAVLIVILSSTKLGLDVNGLQKDYFCGINLNLTLNESLMCQHDSRRTTLSIDVTSFITDVLIAFIGAGLFIDLKRNRIFKQDLQKRRVFYFVCGALCFAFSMVSCILEIVRINVAKSNSYYFKDENALSVCIVILFAVLWILTSVVVIQIRNQNSCFRLCRA